MLIDTAQYLRLPAAPIRVRPILDIHVSEQAFLPSVDILLSDWVATIATPAFKLIRQQQGPQAAFCSIGTGVGLDVLAAIETLEATRVGITDVHESVVSAAAENIRRNLNNPDDVAIEAGYGDLLEPLAPGGAVPPRFDLIYENLPNIPVADAQDATVARKSSGHIPPRTEAIPGLMRQNLLALHYLALLKAKDFLTPGGAVLSLIGGRIPLSVFQEMGQLAGYRSEIFTYGWKIQTDPVEIITGHLRQQEEGFGPYHFYRAARLSEAFEGICLENSGTQAQTLERQLAPDALSPAEALAALQQGEIIGHTVVALRSVLDR
ncbi:MAG: hypothetical protein LBG78_02175 [Azoarcus sp.]|jgi:methylase of polypeptide subunit release factors|nr:hypothetical protein [Azoarcus sp.]